MSGVRYECEGCSLYFLVGSAVEIKVTRVVDCEQNITHSGHHPPLRLAHALCLVVDLETGHHVQHGLGSGEDGEAEESRHQQDTKRKCLVPLVWRWLEGL